MIQYLLQEAIVEAARAQHAKSMASDRCPSCGTPDPRLLHEPNVCRGCRRAIPSAIDLERERWRASYAKATASLGTTSFRRALMLPIGILSLAASLAAIGLSIALLVAGDQASGALCSTASFLLLLTCILLPFAIAWNRRVKNVRAVFEHTVRRAGGVIGPHTFGWLHKHWPGAFPGRLNGIADRFTAAVEHQGVPLLVELRPFYQIDHFTPEYLVLAGVRLPDDVATRIGDPSQLPHAHRLRALGFSLELHGAGLLARGSANAISRAKTEPQTIGALTDVFAVLADLARSIAISRWS